MKSIDKRVVRFIEKHHVMTIATASEKGLYCANLFYAFLPEWGVVFTTEN